MQNSRSPRSSRIQWGGACINAVLALTLVMPATAQTPADRFEAEADVVEVEIPINVSTRAGDPVRGLALEDFEILDQGEVQEIVDFRIVDLATVTPGVSRTEIERAVPATARRHFLLLFDLSFSTPHSLVRAREAARDFVINNLHPTDLVAVATHAVEEGAQLLVTFTPDRAQLTRAIDTLGAPRLLQLSRQDPLRFMIDDPGLTRNNAFTEGDDASPAASLQDSVIEHLRIIGKEIAKAERSFSAGRVSSWSRSMGELARSLDNVSGRKHIVYFSEGFDGRLLLGRRPDADDPSAREDLQNIMAGNLAFVDTDEMYGNSGLQNEVAQMLEQFRRADCIIQAVDIGGLRADLPSESRARKVGQDALFYIADDTGGELYRNANNFGPQLLKVLERSSVTYLVTIKPRDLVWDGAYHHLKVRANLPRGARLSARAGYYAPRPFKDLHQLEKGLLAANAIANAELLNDVVVNVLAAPFRANLESAYVPVVVEAAGASLLVGHEEESLPIELFAYVTDDKGQMMDFFTQRVSLELKARREVFADTGLKYYGHLDLAPGEYLIRVLVRNASTGRAGVQTVEVSVPEYEDAEATMLPPFFVDESRWFLVREDSQTNYSGSVIYPFTVNGEPYIPAARAAIEAETEAELCLVAYNLEPEDFDLAGQILDLDGELVADASFVSFERTVTGIEGVDKFVARLQTGGLSEGEYTLQVALSNETGALHTQQVSLVVH